MVVVAAVLTVWETGADVLVAKSAVATYVAVTDFVPGVVDVNAHEPVPPLRDALHVAVPSLTVTLPPGVPVPGAAAATLTATVYGCPTTVLALRSDVIVVVVVAALTVCAVPVAVVEPAKFPSVA